MRPARLVALACVITVLTACAAEERPPPRAADARTPSPSPTAPRCKGDGYVWQPLVRRTVLVAISDAQQIEIPAHGAARPPEPRLIRPLTAGISTAAVEAGVRPAEAMASLEERTSVSLEPIGTRLVLDDQAVRSKMINESDTPDRGRFVEAVGIRLVTAKFSVRCAGGSVRGTITTWEKGRSHVSVRCGIKEPLPEFDREAERRACPA